MPGEAGPGSAPHMASGSHLPAAGREESPRSQDRLGAGRRENEKLWEGMCSAMASCLVNCVCPVELPSPPKLSWARSARERCAQ